MDYSIVPKINISEAGEGVKVGQYIYFKKIDAIYYKAPYPFPVEIMVSEGLSKCQVTPMFLKLPFILKGWINLDILLREIDLMKLVLTGQLFFHASCVDDCLIVGFPNSGKTYQTYKMVSEGGQLISEEYTLVHKGMARPYKLITRSCFSQKTIDVCKMKISWKEKLHLIFTTLRAWLMPFMFEAVIWRDLPVTGETFKVNKIVYGSTGVEVKNWKALAILTENEFPFLSNDFLQAYSIATGFDMIDIQVRQWGLIKEFCEAIYPVTKP